MDENQKTSHLPEYFMEAFGLGIFMISASLLAIMLESPHSVIPEWIESASLRRLLMGLGGFWCENRPPSLEWEKLITPKGKMMIPFRSGSGAKIKKQRFSKNSAFDFQLLAKQKSSKNQFLHQNPRTSPCTWLSHAPSTMAPLTSRQPSLKSRVSNLTLSTST